MLFPAPVTWGEAQLVHFREGLGKMTTSEAWAVYWAERTPENRNRVAMHELPMVKQVAAKMAKVTGMGVYHDVEDLVSMGTIGLIDAIDRYVPR